MKTKETRLYVRRNGRGMMRAHRVDGVWLFEVGCLTWSLGMPHGRLGVRVVDEETLRCVVSRHGGPAGRSWLEWFDSEVSPSLRGEGRTGIMHIRDLGEVRYIILNGAPHVVARDVAVLLGSTNPSETIRRHCRKHAFGEFKVSKGRSTIKVIDEETATRLALSFGGTSCALRRRLLAGERLFPEEM